MKIRRATTALLLLLAGPPPTAAEPITVAVQVHRSPTELRRLRVADDSVVATNAAGQSWSLPLAEVVAAAERAGALLWPRWLAAPRRSADTPRSDADPTLPTQVDGFEVTAGVRLDGAFFVATLGGGLRDSSGEPVAGSPSEIHDLAVAGELVLLAHDSGLSVFDGRAVEKIDLAGPPASDITALEVAGDTVWAGSFDRGLARFRGGRWERIRLPETHGAGWINALCWDGATLWVGSAAGLGRWVPGLGTVLSESVVAGRIQSIRCGDGDVVAAAAAAVWIGGDGGWRSVDLSGEALHGAVMVGGDLWAVGLRGILHRRDGVWRRATELNGELPDSWITALLPDGESMWAGTYDAGLLRRGRDGRWSTVVAGAWVNPNAMDAGPRGIAVGTMGDGVLIGDRRRWRRLDVAGGLPSDDVTAVRWDRDRLWVGTRAGLAEIRWLE